MTIRSFLTHLLALAIAGAAAAWLALDVKSDGHVDLSTAVGVAVLGTLAGWIWDRSETRAFLAFLIEQIRAFRPLAGSGDEK